jgi:glycosyltransferase involved in cell wall biosynthesis
MSTVSVVMATCNGARFIDEQLASLRSQTLLPMELVVSDDCSTDETLEKIESFRLTAPFPVIVRRNAVRLGYGENFLSATKLARGDYVAYCDQDDVWYPAKLQTAVTKLSQSGADLFVHGADLIDEDGNEIGIFSQGISDRRIYKPLQLDPWFVFYGFSMVFSRDLFTIFDIASRGKHTFEFEGLLSHDLWIYFLAMSLGDTLVEPTPLAHYRQHRSNQTPHIPLLRLRAFIVSLGVAAHPKLRRSEIAAQRSALLAELGRSAKELRLRQKALRAASYWGKIAQFESDRLKFYLRAGILQRTTGCISLIGKGGYRSFRRGGLGLGLLIKDALVGVMRARRIGQASRALG